MIQIVVLPYQECLLITWYTIFIARVRSGLQENRAQNQMKIEHIWNLRYTVRHPTVTSHALVSTATDHKLCSHACDMKRIITYKVSLWILMSCEQGHLRTLQLCPKQIHISKLLSCLNLVPEPVHKTSPYTEHTAWPHCYQERDAPVLFTDTLMLYRLYPFRKSH